MKDVIRVATRGYSHRGGRGVRTYLHINCGCRIGLTLQGTYGTMDEARRAAYELLEGTGDYYRVCSKSGLVNAQALDRPVRHFDDTMTAAASTFNGAGVRDGDVLVVTSEGVVAIVIGTAVIAITTSRGSLTALDTSARSIRNGLYAEVVDRAVVEARKICATVDPLHATPVVEKSEAQEPAAAAEEAAVKLASIERRVRSLAADVVTPRTMFDPELTYYGDGTRVVMRARGGAERCGTTFGMAASGLPNVYAFQAVRWDGGDADLVAPHVLHRAGPATPADVVRTDGVLLVGVVQGGEDDHREEAYSPHENDLLQVGAVDVRVCTVVRGLFLPGHGRALLDGRCGHAMHHNSSGPKLSPKPGRTNARSAPASRHQYRDCTHSRSRLTAPLPTP
ncbi:hypothetical protein [Streptomyces nigra]